MNEEEKVVDINSAELADLITLPGVSLKKAEKIIAGRPYSSVDDLQEINGIGQALFARIAHLIYVNPHDQEKNLEEWSDTPSDTEVHVDSIPVDYQIGPGEAESAGYAEILTPNEPVESPISASNERTAESQLPVFEPEFSPESSALPAITPETAGTSGNEEPAPSPGKVESPPTEIKQTAPPPRPSKTQEGPKSDRQFGSMLTCGVVSILLSIAFTLGILYLINASLQYVTPATLRQTEGKLAELNVQASSIKREVETLTTRLDNLESIAGRVTAVENEITKTRSEIEEVSSNLAAIEKQIGELNQQVDELQSSANQFKDFLDGLRGLLESISTPTPVEK